MKIFRTFLCGLAVFLLVLSLSSQTVAPMPQIVGEGVISAPTDEFGGSLSPDGQTLYFSRSVPPHYIYGMFASHRNGNSYGSPELLPFSGIARDSDPVLSPDGKTLLFVSDRAVNGADPKRFLIYSARWNGNGWNEPVPLPSVINQLDKSCFFASLTRNGNLYFTCAKTDDPTIRVYSSMFVNDEYAQPIDLGPEINQEGYVNIEAFVDPDEHFLLIGAFSRPDTIGSSDIYVSVRKDDHWLKPIHLDPPINSVARDYSPRLSPDGKWLYFTSERGAFSEDRNGRPWTYREFQQSSRSIKNGLGNIYRISIEALHVPELMH